MSNLDRWLPFRFRRKDDHAKRQESSSQAHAGAVATDTSSAMSVRPTPMQALMEEMFNDTFFREPFARLDHLDRWFGDFSPVRFSPSVEVSDEGKALKVTAELPGMSREDIKLQLDDGMLVISGQKKSEEESNAEGIFRTERYYGYFQRAVPIPEDVNVEQSSA